MSPKSRRRRSGALPPTSYAVLGLLSTGDDLSGYEVKQRADSALWFHWAAPAMSQIYDELSRLTDSGLVTRREDATTRRRTARYRLTEAGMVELSFWAGQESSSFPVLKHPVVLRLLLGDLIGETPMRDLLTSYADQIAGHREELQQVSDSLSDEPGDRFSSYVAEWGLRYYDFEDQMARQLIEALRR